MDTSQELLEHHHTILNNLGTSFVAGNRLELLIDGSDTFPGMFKDLEQANISVLVESYTIDDSEIGEELSDILCRKASLGLDIFVIYDSVGSHETTAEYFENLENSGIVVCEYNPVNPLNDSGNGDLNNRDHRKLIVIDNDIAYTGGINISSEYSSSSIPRFSHKSEDSGWRDTHLRLQGPIVNELTKTFLNTLEEQQCKLPSLPMHKPPGKNYDGSLVAILAATGEEDTSPIYEAILAAIDGSRQSILITIAYFSPDKKLVESLMHAANRGVLVELLMPEDPDWALLKYASYSYFEELMQSGVKIHLYTDRMLHAKTVVIDDVWSTVGSMNMDMRSLKYNREINAIILDKHFAGEMSDTFEDDLKNSRNLDVEKWRQRGISCKMMEWFARLWERWL